MILRHLDNAATSHPKPASVVDAVAAAVARAGSPARGSGAPARAAAAALRSAREDVAAFLGAPPDRLAFTLNATDALNVAVAALARDGGCVVVSELEHSAVLRPLLSRARAGRLDLRRVAPRRGRLDPRDVAAAASGASLVAVTLASNVTGLRQPVEEIARALPPGVPLLVDAAQAAGSLAIDVSALGDLAVACASGHKALLGPMGCGVLVVGAGVELRPLREGGTGDGADEHPLAMPESLEAGTPPLPAILGLQAGVAWWREQGPERIRERERTQVERMTEALRAAGADLPGWEAGERAPLVSFRLPGLSPEETAVLLESEHGVIVRAGLHCAPSAHRVLGTWPDGLVRASVGPTTSDDDVAAFCAAIADLARG